MLRVAIIIGSTRSVRKGEVIGRWVYEVASKRDDAVFEIVDLKDFKLPHLDETMPTGMEQDKELYIKAWSTQINSFDAYVFVTPEYNHAPPGVLKNAIDHLYSEWQNKAAGFVSYGASGGRLAVEHLRLIMAELQIADVREQVSFTLSTDFENYKVFHPRTHQEKSVNAMLDQIIAWGSALKQLRLNQKSKAS